MMKKRGVLSLWKTIILVIFGLVAVAGVTVLTLYLTGKFDDPNIDPQDMSFSQTVDDGLASFNAAYSNDSDSQKGVHGRYEASSDFSMTISSSTEGVTNDLVTLYLEGGRRIMQGQTAMITDDVITVPETVRLNRAFQVKLNTLYNQAFFDNWIVGGSSFLTATSENVVLQRTSARIFVDVPVREIQTQIHGSVQNGTEQEVVIGSTFTIDTTFLPADSQYIFKDENSAERKLVVFSTTAEPYVRYDEDAGVFYAEQRTASAAQLPTITAYTFANSYYQKLFLEANQGAPDFNDLLRNYFRQNPTHAVTADLQIKVLDVNVDSVAVDAAGQTFTSFVDTHFVLTANSVTGDKTLGINIKDNQNKPLNSLLGNVGIKLTKDTQDLKVLDLKVLGGNLIKVTSQGITRETYDPSENYFNKTDADYYLLPNTTPVDYGNYYWRFSPSAAQNIEFEVNFFYEDENGDWKNFFAFDAEKQFTFSAVVHDNEEDPAWKENSQIRMEINYDSNGNMKPARIDLSNLLNPINSENVYQTVKYFLFINGAEAGNLDLTEYFSCGAGKQYTNLSVPDIVGKSDYTLYALDDTSLAAIKSFAGNVRVIAAIIKTDADKVPYLDADGKYIIVKASRSREIVVESSLSVANMTTTFGLDDPVSKDGEFYIPAVNRNDSGMQKSVIDFNLSLSSDNKDTDAAKLHLAYTSDKLRLVCLDQNGNETQFVELEGFERAEGDETDGVICYKGYLRINENLFAAGTSGVAAPKYIKLQLQYDDGKTLHTKDVVYGEDDTKDHFYIYYQQPVSMQAAFEAETGLDANADGVIDSITVSINSTNGVEIVWGNKTFAGTTEEKLAELNTLFGVTLTDQFGEDIDKLSGLYSVRLQEVAGVGNQNIISLSQDLSKIEGFVSTQGQAVTTQLRLIIVDAEGNQVREIDNKGHFTTNFLQSELITLNVTSEGVSKVQRDVSEVFGEQKLQDNMSGSSPNIKTVSVAKYVTSGNTIAMNDLMKVYTKSGAQDVEVQNIKFKLDDSVASWSATRRADIMKMISFNVDPNGGGNASEPQNADDAIENYLNTEIKNVLVINPFKEDTQIKFVVTDANNSLFEISLTLTFKSNIGVSSTFESCYTEDQKNYLVSKDNSITLLADQDYDLDTYLAFTNSTYSWEGALENIASLGAVLEEEAGKTGLITLTKGSNPTKILLHTAEVFQFTETTVRIYYGIKSEYAFYAELTIFINPNIIVKEENKVVDLSNMSNQKLSTTHNFYKLSSYFAKGCDFEGCETYTFTGASYTNTSSGKYISIVYNNTDYNLGYYDPESGTNTLTIQLGEQVEQYFGMTIYTGGNSVSVDAVKVKVSGEEKEVVLCDYAASKHLSLQFVIGYGSGSLQDTVDSILKGESNSVPVVTYGGETMLLLMPQTDYVAQNSFGLEVDETNNFASVLGTTLSTSATQSFISATDNIFTASKTLTKDDVELQVVITLKALVSKVGEHFFYYNYKKTGADFNKYKDVDFDKLIGDYQLLEQNDVFEELKAGKPYTIAHDSDEVSDKKPGFYYSSGVAGVAGQLANTVMDISIVENAQGYIPGLASINGGSLKINHLTSKYEESYIVLKCTLSTTSTQFSWYYRIKVTPSAEITDVSYPFANDGEYLDEDSSYFDGEKYVINFAEQLQNSKNDGKTRFGKVTFPDNPNPPLVFGYEYSTTATTDVTLSWDGNVLTISGNLSESTITVTRKVLAGGAEIVGAEQNYVIFLNQGTTYKHSLKQKGGNANETPLTADGNTYNVTISAGSGEVVFSPEVYINTNGIDSKVSDLNMYISGEGLSGALKQCYLEKGTKLYSDTACTDTAEIYNGFLVDKIEAYNSEKTIYKVIINQKTGSPQTFYVKREDLKFDYEKSSDKDYVASKTYYTTTDEKTFTVFTPTFTSGVTYYEKNGDDYAQTEDTVYNPSNTYYTTTDGGTTYSKFSPFTPGVDYYEWTPLKFAYMDDDNKIHIQIKDTVDQDYAAEIGVYTSEKVVFKINLTITSYFTWQLNDSFDGGKTYYFYKTPANPNTEVTDTIFTKLESKLEGKTISKVEISVADKDQDIVKRTTGSSDWKNSTIQFAHLTEDRDFTFNVTITASDASTYSFSFTITVSKSYDKTQVVTITDTKAHYGTIDILLGQDESCAQSDMLLSALKEKLDFAKDVYTADGVVVKDVVKFVNGNDYTDSLTITPKNVDRATTIDKTISMAYLFENKEIFTFNFIYRYTVYPNVTVETNYPKPDGTHESEAEYVSSGTGFEDFFNKTAPFADKTRFVVDKAKGVVNGVEKTVDPTSFKYTIEINSIENVELTVIGTNGTTTYNSSSTNRVICENVDTNTVTSPSCTVIFALTNSQSSGSVEFNFTCNAVTVQYKVIVVDGEIVTMSTNSPNYSTNGEVVYAEDLAQMRSLAMFEENRIVSAAFKETVAQNSKYFFRFVSGNTTKVFEITASQVSRTLNIDLGESLTGYAYGGAFRDKTSAQNNVLTNKYNDSDIFASTPILTSRVVAKYYDGTPIKLSETNKLLVKYNATIGNSAQDFTLPEIGDKKSVALELYFNTTQYQTKFYSYKFFVDLEFTVENPTTANIQTVQTIYAGTELSLFDYYNTAFGIKNSRTGEKYTKQTMANSSGTFALYIYGFSDNPIDRGAPESIHKSLISKVDENGIKYSTGLNPRAGMTLNAGAGDDLSKNYITISGSTNNGKVCDYILHAQGCNNDGNHVMMKVVYTVEVNGRPITRTFDIMFKIVPGDDTEVRFKSRHEEANVTNPSAQEFVEDHNVTSNYQSPYAISGGDVTLNLWNDADVNDENVGVINAYMYGGANFNSANKFTYTYTIGSSDLNDWAAFNDTLGGSVTTEGSDNSNWMRSDTSDPYTGEKKTSTDSITGTSYTHLPLYVPTLKLGEKKLMIEAENSFGYKIRFYITITAAINPQVSSITSTILTEKTTVGVGARYQTVSVSQETDNGTTRVVYQPFDYDKEINQIDYSVNNVKIEKVRLKTTIMERDSEGKETGVELEATKTMETVSDSKIIIASDDGWTVGTKDKKVAAEDLNGRPITLSFTATRSGTSGVGIYSVTYAGTALEQTHTISSTYTYPAENDGNKPDTSVYLSGIKAYAYGGEVVDTNSAGVAKAISEIDDVKVRRIDYYLGDTWLGGSTPDGKIVKEDSVIANALYTSANVFFVKSTGTVSGVNYSSDLGFAVPVISGIYYGTGNTLSGVTMRITLVDGDGNNPAYLYQKVTLKRAASSDNMFASTNIVDGTSPTVTTDVSKFAGDVYNDTLEVKLAPGASVTFVISDKDSSALPAGYEGLTKITKTNNRAYSITEYVGISASIDNLGNNLSAGSNFNVYIVEQKGDVEFVYNKELSKKPYIKTADTNYSSSKTYYTKKTDGTYIKFTPSDPSNPSFVSGVTYYERGVSSEEKYFISTDTEYDTDKTYYTSTDGTTFTKYVPAFGSGVTYYTYESTNKTYIEKSSDTAYSPGTTYYTMDPVTYSKATEIKTGIKYYTYDSGVYTEASNTSDTSKDYYIKNPETYTKYVPKFGSETYYEKIEAISFTGTIAEYSGTTLNIEHVNELNSSNCKRETLYFLFKVDEQTYQYVQDFNVYPCAKSAKHPNTDEQGNYVVEVADYLKVSKGSGANEKAYYVATLPQWAKDITLDPYKVGTTDVGTVDSNLYTKSYQYFFEINTGAGGAGSAFIDENGMITTSEDFDVKTHTITVNVYMKVSGFDGKFEDSNTRLKLGQFRLYFKQGVFESNTTEMDDTEDDQFFIPAEMMSALSSRSARAATADNSGVYTITQNGWTSTIAIASGYMLTPISSSITFTKVTLSETEGSTFAYNVGETVNLADLVEGKVSNVATNKTYHMVAYSGTGAGAAVNYIVRGNIVSWTFDKAGEYYYYILVTGRNGSGDFATDVIKIKLMCYDTSTRESYKVKVEGAEYDLDDLYTDSTTRAWYELTDGAITELTGGEQKDLKLGITSKTYLVSEGGSFKLVDVTFYVYEGAETKDVAIRPQTNFALSNLVEGTAEFYNGETFERVYNENISMGEGSNPSQTYYVVTRNADGTVATAKLYTVNYKIISAEVKEESGYISSAADLKTAAEDLIKADLKLGTTDFTLNEMAANGVLTTPNAGETAVVTSYQAVAHDNIVLTAAEGKEQLSGLYELGVDGKYSKTRDTTITAGKTYYKKIDSTRTLITKTYLAVVAKDGKQTFHRYRLTFYVYEETKTIECLTPANTAFELSTLSESVREELSVATGAQVSYYTLEKNALTQVTTISLEESATKEYYVLVGQKYYLITFDFTIGEVTE